MRTLALLLLFALAPGPTFEGPKHPVLIQAVVGDACRSLGFGFNICQIET